MAYPLPDVMYGTREGVALDRGAAEAARRLRQPAVSSFSPGTTPAMRAGGSPEAAAFRTDQANFQAERAARESLRTGGPAPTAPTAPATPAKPTSALSRVGRAATAPIRAVANIPGAITNAMNADVVKGVKTVMNSPMLRAAGAVGGAVVGAKNLSDVYSGNETPTEDYRTALGISDAHRAGVRSFLGKVGIGENEADFANDLAVRGLGVLGENFVPGFNPRGASSRQPVSAPASAPPTRSGQMPLPAGVAPSNAGAGRGSPLNPLRTDMNPSDPRFGAARDFGPELAGLPDKLPNDLRSGAVFKTQDANGRPVYSGRDVRAGAQMVDGLGRGTGQLSSVSSLDTSEGFRQNLLELERNAAERAASPVGGVGGFNTSDPIDALRAKQAGGSGSPATRAERVARAEMANRAAISAAQTGATLRGQELSAKTAMRGQDLVAETARGNTRATLRGQDRDYAQRIDAKKMDLAAKQAQRQAIAAAWEGTTDPQVAAARLAASGYDPASALAVAGGQRAASESSAKNFDKITEAAGATTDKDGKPVLNPALQAVAQNTIANAMPGVRNASAADQNRRLREVQSAGNLATGLQEAQGGSLFQTLGINKAPPPISALPNFQGASLRERGFGSPFANASRGDYELVQPDGTVAPIKRERIGERELDYLKRQGTTLRVTN